MQVEYKSLGWLRFSALARAIVDRAIRAEKELLAEKAERIEERKHFQEQIDGLIDRALEKQGMRALKPQPRLETSAHQPSDNLLTDFDRVYGEQLKNQVELELYEQTMMQKAEAEFEKDINQIVGN